MVVPSDPTTDLVVIEPGLAVAGLEHLLNPVPLPLGANHFGQGDLGAGVAQGVVDPRLADRTDHHQTLLRPDPSVLFGPDAHAHRIDHQRPLLAAAEGDPLPPRLRLTRRPDVGPLERHLALAADAGLLPWRATPLQVAHGGVAGYVQHVTLRPSTQRSAELGGPAEFVITHDPAVGQAGQAPVQQVQRDPPLLLEVDLRRDMALRAPGLIVSPILGQVELAVQRGVTGLRGIGQEDADLAVVDLAQPAAPLASDATGFRPLLGEGAGVDDHDALRLGEFLPDMEPQLGHHGLVVPLTRADEELDRLARQPGLDRDRLTGLALQSAEEPADDQGGVLALLGAIELGQIALEKGGQTVGAVADGVG